jgi:uncharacterized membrane-anchored protein YhcB (DUF1043 family)
MDQNIINWVYAACGFAYGWVLKVLWEAISDLRKDVKQIERDLPDVYMRKDDFRAVLAEQRADFRELKNDVKAEFTKLDQSISALVKRFDDTRGPHQ